MKRIIIYKTWLNRERFKPGYVKGFTLVEMLVVIAVSSLLVLLGMLYFQNIRNYIRQENTNTRKSLDFMYFSNTLKKDFYNSELARYYGSDNELVLEMKDGLLTYQFTKEKIIRSATGRDTFDIHTGEVAPIFIENDKAYIKALELAFNPGSKQELKIMLTKPVNALQLFMIQNQTK